MADESPQDAKATPPSRGQGANQAAEEPAPQPNLSALFYAPDVVTRTTERKGFWERHKDAVAPLSVLLALISTVTTAWISWRNIKLQVQLKEQDVRLQIRLKEQDVIMKEQELTFKGKQESYTLFNQAAANSFRAVDVLLDDEHEAIPKDDARYVEQGEDGYRRGEKELGNNLADINKAFYQLEPFLPQNIRAEIFKAVGKFGDDCYYALARAKGNPSPSEKRSARAEFVKRYNEFREEARNLMFNNLFKTRFSN